jgi:hypothetical protein
VIRDELAFLRYLCGLLQNTALEQWPVGPPSPPVLAGHGDPALLQPRKHSQEHPDVVGRVFRNAPLFGIRPDGGLGITRPTFGSDIHRGSLGAAG